MAAPLAGVSPLFAVFFAGCAVGRHLQTTHPDQEMTFIQNMNSGALAGIFTTIVMVPGERIKCLLQVQSHGHAPSGVHYDGPLDVVKKLYKQGGLTSLYRGTGATLLRGFFSPFFGTLLSTYAEIQEITTSWQTN
ncbi:dif-1 domain protein [Teladorsagia circumcincta]|uniref:Dif-1 domain protein n=1 Tax=Teladorsagia circumcincta TaxID=45464 RepID=A0A2G9TG58_TELCI|nr:dif-1 domain protein [Teladorsagia circumcincta]